MEFKNMNNFKKLGLTALVGSLAATTAHAGTLSVGGTADFNYQTHGDGSATGNPMSSTQDISFGASADLDNGMTMSYSSNMTASAISAQSITLDMGDAGTLGIYNLDSHGAGLSKYQDVVPTAGEQVWDDTGVTSHGGIDNGVLDHTAGSNLGYNGSFGDITVSAAWAKTASGAEGSAVLVYDNLIDGLSLGYGTGESQESAGNSLTTDQETMFVKYTTGPVVFGFQRSVVTPSVATGTTVSTTEKTRDGYGVSFAVNENLSISVGQSDLDFDTASLVDQTDSGISASYTMGSTTIGLVHNRTEDAAGVAADDYDVSELKITFAF